MAVPFPDIDPYETLGVKNDDSPTVIKRAYYKLCLKYHPDKLSEEEQELHKVTFEKIQFSYSILCDLSKRERYDKFGKLESFGDGDNAEGDDFDWSEFFDEMKNSTQVEITQELIEKDKKDYQNSKEEYDDLIDNYIFYKGDFIRLFEVIPHLEFTVEEEKRIFKIINECIENGDIDLSDISDNQEITKKTNENWKNYNKNRKLIIRSELKKLKDESKEAELLLEEIVNKQNKKNKSKGLKQIKMDSSEESLMQLIQNKNRDQKSSFDKLLAKYETGGDKYSDSKKKKNVKNNNKRSEYDIGDDEFEKLQKKLLNKKRKTN
ncbi:hypothetical protein BVG19_g3495 [[Candida] boidinii]|nr:hypothetical protein BVG19_g3495 [[Candida] boidinii]OWB51029.1 binding protein [[Candida] boidinii]